MEKRENSNFINSTEADDAAPKDELQELLQTLEHADWYGRPLVKYDGFWCPTRQLRPILSIQKHFKAKDTDIILSTMPKSGTTWLKALTFSIVNRKSYTIDQSPLLTTGPHDLVPFLEYRIYRDEENPDLEGIPNPRVFANHIRFGSLPSSILKSKCRIIYICRNPLDQFISYRRFWLDNKIFDDVDPVLPLELDEAFNMFCQGIHPYGAFWDHVLDYWNAHLKNPEKVLFLKYEGLKEDISCNVKKIAEFIGLPFSLDEEKQGVVQGISRLCSFENLSNLEVNKNGITAVNEIKNSSFFTMADRFKSIMEEKFEGSGLMFKMS